MADIDDLLAAVAAGPQGPDVGAFFDFDGTLIRGYSAVLYFRQRMASRAVGPQELIGTLVEVFNMHQRGYDVTRLVGVGLGALQGTALTDLEEVGQQLPSADLGQALPRRPPTRPGPTFAPGTLSPSPPRPRGSRPSLPPRISGSSICRRRIPVWDGPGNTVSMSR